MSFSGVQYPEEDRMDDFKEFVDGVGGRIVASIILLNMAALCLSAVPVDAATVSFDCTFATFSDEKAAQQKQNKPFVLRYVLDTNAQKAYLLGDLGSSKVIPVGGTLGITFLEIH